MLTAPSSEYSLAKWKALYDISSAGRIYAIYLNSLNSAAPVFRYLREPKIVIHLFTADLTLSSAGCRSSAVLSSSSFSPNSEISQLSQ